MRSSLRRQRETGKHTRWRRTWTALRALLLVVAACNGGDGSPRGAEILDGAARVDGSRSASGAEAPPPPPLAGVGCGAPGQPCCSGNFCRGGGCCALWRCVAPGDSCAPVAGTCENGACGACGSLGGPCCAGDACTQGGTRCEHLTCVRCGTAAGEACCTFPSDVRSQILPGVCAGEGLTCADLSCVACGGPREPCCAGYVCTGHRCCYSGACVEPGQNCGSGPMSSGTCSGGYCTGCGRRDQACCGDGAEACYESDLFCQGNRCGSCGRPGEVCCVPNGRDPPCLAGSTCSRGICAACGGPGEPCCRDTQCNGDNCCLAGRCFAPGDPCQVDFYSYGACRAGRCGCGRDGEPCCPAPAGQFICSDPGVSCVGPPANPGACKRK
jgi:hypothetical protein